MDYIMDDDIREKISKIDWKVTAKAKEVPFTVRGDTFIRLTPLGGLVHDGTDASIEAYEKMAAEAMATIGEPQ